MAYLSLFQLIAAAGGWNAFCPLPALRQIQLDFISPNSRRTEAEDQLKQERKP